MKLTILCNIETNGFRKFAENIRLPLVGAQLKITGLIVHRPALAILSFVVGDL